MRTNPERIRRKIRLEEMKTFSYERFEKLEQNREEQANSDKDN